MTYADERDSRRQEDGRRAEALRAAALDVMLDPFALLEPVRDDTGAVQDFRYLEANPAAAAFFGVTREEVVGALFTLLLTPADGRSLVSALAEVVAGGGPLVLDSLNLVSELWGGENRRFDLHAVPVEGCVEVVWRDVTDRVLAAERLAESEELFRTALESAPIGICLVALDGTFRRVNPALCALLGRDQGTLLGLTWADVTHPDDVAADQALMDDLRAGRRESFRLRKRFLRPDGTVVHGDLSVGCVREPDGRVRHFVAQTVDVTEEHRQQEALAEERARLAAVLASELEPHVYLEAARDPAGAIVDFVYRDANDAACAYMTMAREDLVGRRVLDLLPGQAGSGMLAMYAAAVESGEPLALDDYSYPHEILSSERRYDIRAVRVGDGLSFAWRDVTERHEAAERLAASEQRYRLLADNSSDVIMLADDRLHVLWVSPSTQAVLGRPPEDLLGDRGVELIHPDDRPGMREQVEAGNREGVVTRLRFRWRRGDGTYLWVEAAGRYFLDPESGRAGRVVQVRDIDAQVRAEEALARRARTDALTGLLNREEALRRLDATLAHDPRAGQQVAVLFCDLDGLKAVNDRYGHAMGDLLLASAAARIVGAVRADDLVARIGGDEILVVLTGVTDLGAAVAVAEKVRLGVAEPITVAEAPAGVTSTVSIGLTLARPGDDVDRVIARADIAMYAAKQAGGDTTAMR